MRPFFTFSLTTASIALAVASSWPESDRHEPKWVGAAYYPMVWLAAIDGDDSAVYREQLVRATADLREVCDVEKTDEDITRAVSNAKTRLAWYGHSATTLGILEGMLAEAEEKHASLEELGSSFHSRITGY